MSTTLQHAPAQPLRAPLPGPTDLTVGEVIATIRRNAALILAAGVIGAVLAYAYAARQPRVYTAAASVAVEGDRLAIPELQGALRADNSPDPMPFVRTEVQALGARQLIIRLIGELGLANTAEFNPALRPPGAFDGIIASLKSLFPSRPAPPATGTGPDDTIVNAVSRALAVGHDNRSLVISVAFTAQSPALAATAVNRLVADYVEEREARRREADRAANGAIAGRIEQVRHEIERIENDMKKLRAESGLIALRAGSLGQQQVEELSTEATRAAAQRSEIENQLARAQAASAGGSIDALASVLGSETTSRLRQSEAEAAARAASLAARFGRNYPPLVSAEADLAATRRQIAGEARRIVASLSTQLAVATAHEADLKRQLVAARQEGAAAQDAQARLQQMQQDVATRRALYSTLLEREQQTLSQPRGGQLPDVRVINRAEPPTLPSAPNMKMAALFGGGAASLLATAAAFTLAPKRRRFATVEEAQRATGARLLATIPLPPSGVRGLAEQVAAAPRGAAGSALRAVPAQLPANARRGGQTVAIVSQTASTATSSALALARAASLDRPQTLLIAMPAGANSALPPGHHAGALDRVLTGHTAWPDALARDPATPLELLVGDGGAASADLPVALENLLEDVRQDFALIVLSAPGAQETAVKAADSVVLVVDLARDGADTTLRLAQDVARLTRATPWLLVLGRP